MNRMNTPSGNAIAPKATVMSHSRDERCAVLVNSAPISTIKYWKKKRDKRSRADDRGEGTGTTTRTAGEKG